MLRFFATIAGLALIMAVVGAGGILFVFHKYGSSLPDYLQLADYEPPVMTRTYAGDGRLMSEYAVEKRVFVPIKAMPRRVVRAFLSAEDKNFYHHAGVDFFGVARATLVNIANIGKGRRLVGASTITQQVAKNFLLTNERSWERKVKEAILAFRMELAFEKDRILELYLNEIYLGFGSYGVAAAALNYFDKSMDELTIAEAALLAALPKAPNNYNPIEFPEAAKERRDWVIDRMLKDGVISAEEAESGRNESLITRRRSMTDYVSADYFSEEVRRQLANRYGEGNLYKGGLSVRTTVNPRLQEIAERQLRRGLEVYDRRHGWRGPVARVDPAKGLDWRGELSRIDVPEGIGDWRPAVVLRVDKENAGIGFADGALGRIPLAEMKWARPWREKQTLGPIVRHPGDVLSILDVVLVQAVAAAADAGGNAVAYPEGTYGLRQIPALNGALAALDPHTGRVLAMAGGYSFKRSQFNWATQAMRQPGSAFKPFIYLAALDAGYTPATMILDAPFVIDQGPGLPKWRPSNYTQKFYGPSTMRLGIEKSRNLMTVRLAQTIGMDLVSEYAKRFGVVEKMPTSLANALGSDETTLLKLTGAYAMLVNGGKKITPSVIDRIQDRHGRTVFRHDRRDCPGCRASYWTNQNLPVIPDVREAVTSPASAYQVVSMLQGVVERGTGKRISVVGKPLAGKTGTTNDSKDTWFIGFSPDLAVGVFAGFDTPETLGKDEQGASVAVPIFRDFMAEALSGRSAVPFRIPPGIRLVKVDSQSGRLAGHGDRNVILEAFKPDTEPTGAAQVLEGYSSGLDASATGTGGLY